MSMSFNYTNENGTTSWYPEPTTRGTWSLIYSSVFTLSLCVYTAIHVNIPQRGDTANVQFWRKMKWVVVAVFAPEVVLFSAWQQYYIAGQFCRALHNIALEKAGLPTISMKTWVRRMYEQYVQTKKQRNEDQTTTEEALKQHQETLQVSPPPRFSRMFGFYVLMGGLVVDVSHLYDNDKVSRMTLTPAGVLKFAKESSWERFIIPDETISDKSKTDRLGKLLVFLQVIWTIFQCISRQVLGYPLTVLEVHVLVHAICALCMYAFWFDKPLNVLDPSYVNLDAALDCSLALEMMRTPGSAYYPFTNLRPQRQFQGVGCNNRKQEQYLDSASEAAFVVFDTNRLQQVLEQSIEGRLSVVSILLADTTRGPFRETENPRSTVGEVRGISAEVRRQGIGRISTGSLESQEPSSPRQHIAHIHRVTLRDSDTVMSLSTGQILTCGVGPAAFATSSLPPDSVMIRAFLARHLRWKSLAKPELQGVELDFPFKEQMIPIGYRYSHGSNKILRHAMTVDLSEKDLSRWRRAAIAFALEYAAATPEQQESMTGLTSLAGQADHARLCFLAATTDWKRDGMNHIEKNDDLYYTECFVMRCENFSFRSFSAVKDSQEVFAGAILSFLLISGSYASVHLALWKHEFPTQVEQLLWRIASCILVSPCGLAVVCAIGILLLLPGFALYAWFENRNIRKAREAELRRCREPHQPPHVGEAAPLATEPGSVEQAVHVVVDTGADNNNAICLCDSQQIQDLEDCSDLAIPATSEAVSGGKHAHPIARTSSVANSRVSSIISSRSSAPASLPAAASLETAPHDASQASAPAYAHQPQPKQVISKKLTRTLDALMTLGRIVLIIPTAIVVVALVCLVPGYVLARLYIVVESFISLRRVPLGVYETTSWAQHFPHL